MTTRSRAGKLVAAAAAGLCVLTGCSFNGVNSLPLPGTVGGGRGSRTYNVELANVGTLESNSPVMINDVIVGSIRRITIKDRHADLQIVLKPGTTVPANAIAKVGQTSLLGSMHLELAAPLGQEPHGTLGDHATIPLNRSATYPSTEQTLAALAAVVNDGGLGQLGGIVHSFNAALTGRQQDIRQLLERLNTFVSTLDDQRDNIIDTISQLDRLATTMADRQADITRALQKIPPALAVLVREQPRLTDALDRLRMFSTTATQVIGDTTDNLATDLHNLAPTIEGLADIGPDIDSALGFATTFPFNQNLIDRGVRGDYMNLFVTVDLTRERLKRGLLLGTHWGDPDIKLVPAPGDPGFDRYYTHDPLGVGPAVPAPSTPVPPAPAGGN